MNLKVVSFNIRYCDDPNGHTIPERAPRLRSILDSIDADLIGLQEVRPAWEPFLEADYGDKYEIFLKDRGDSESGPILWKKDKFDCVQNGYFWLSDTPEVESKGWDELHCPRICVYSVLKEKSSGKQFCFMNTHYGFGDRCQIDSGKLISKYSKSISDLPTFITGDFNMNPNSLGYAEITKLFTDANSVTLKYAGTTYHAYEPETQNSHIDYCFVNQKVKPVSTTLLDQTFDGKYPSDHYGMLFELEI